MGWFVDVRSMFPYVSGGCLTPIIRTMFSMGATKVSILLFYRRVLSRTSGKRFHWINNATIGAILIYSVTCFFQLIFKCYPVQAFWLRYSRNPPYTASYRCANEGAGMISYSAISAVSDFWIAVLPLFFLRRMQMPQRQKWALAALFGLGFM